MITTLHRLLHAAERHAFAIPAFNVTNLESVQAVLQAAAQAKSPVIIQTSELAIQYAGPDTLLNLMRSVAQEIAPKIPVVIHLDHGKHYPVVESCIKRGYTSVHMDASEQPWKKNVQLTKKAVQLGHRHGITVQGELGYLLGYEGMTKIKFDARELEKLMTDPDQAHEFVLATGVDTLAVAIGTAHGFFQGTERIDFQRLQAIRTRVNVPVVLHGGSGVPMSQIKKGIAHGIKIINVDTTLRLAFMSGLQKSIASYDPTKKVDIRTYLSAGRLTMQQEAGRLMSAFGSAGRA